MELTASAILRNLNIALQPLVNLTTNDVIGYEALARPAGALAAPATLFDTAIAGGWIADVELTVAARAFEHHRLAPDQRFFLNVHPAALESRGFAQRLRRVIRAARVVIEITEQGPITRPDVALENIEELRSAGAYFALDDFGSGYAHMRWLHDIRPRFIKLAQSIATDFERVPWRRSVVRNLHSFAREAGCAVIAEGIESEGTADAARDMGIEIGQGYYFGRPEIANLAAAA
ncbi:MAG TPA: EAL domain-containing protein [Thermoanaerobaculia bacterium]|nr:EAL domain-containing protein [Thermoanaerobaculia bacterium]